MIVNGISIPDNEGWYGKDNSRTFDTYQKEFYESSMKFFEGKPKRVSLDIGAHIGMMTSRMAQDFEHVYAFEPLFTQNLRYNTLKFNNITYYQTAVGDSKEFVNMMPGLYNTGGSKIDKAGTTFVSQVRIDDFEFTNVDFVKIDVEGHELQVLLGMKKTLQKNLPVILIELLYNVDTHKSIYDLLHNELGYKSLNMGSDSIFYHE